MAATIIQFPQSHSNAFSNLSGLIELASDNLVVEEYAELAELYCKEGHFKPGEVEQLQEQIRKKRLNNAKPEKKPAIIPNGSGVYCYTPEMGEQKPDCQVEASRGYYGKHWFVDTPLELKGRGITFLKKYEGKDLTTPGSYKVGWNEYQVTNRAFEKLKEQYTISQELFLD